MIESEETLVAKARNHPNLKFFLDADLKYAGTSPLISTIGLCRKKQSQGRVACASVCNKRGLARIGMIFWLSQVEEMF
jgi:hypothetical protein